jgi:hypothetical protein
MTPLPIKPQYGPTLGRLLEPRWRALSRNARTIAIAIGVCLLAGAVALVLSLLDAEYSHGGRVPFSFKYRGLYRAAPAQGGYVRVALSPGGRLLDSYEVAPLRIAGYSGSVTGELPLLASTYEQTLERRFKSVRLEGEGKTRISSTLAGYQVLYRAEVSGRTLFGRDVMLLPSSSGVREGVVIEMLSAEPASVSRPVASSGLLERPLKTFAFG